MIKQLMKNIRYTVIANFITLFISVFITLVVPRKMGVSNYGYFQLYLFYISYASLFHLGIPDGIYLKIGGEFYEDLNASKLKEQLVSLLLISIVFSSIFSVYFLNFSSGDKQFIYLASIISILISNLKTFFLFILQATNRIKEYARFTRLDRIVFFILIISYVVFSGESFKIIIFFDIISRIIVLVLLSYTLKDLINNRISSKAFIIFMDTLSNILVGGKLMLSYVAGLLIIGVVRFSIEAKWSISTFGKISLVLSISNMMMTFINAVSVVLFPVLRRMKKENQKKLYIKIRNMVVPISFFLLILYLPAKFVISLWLPKYGSSMVYLGILFPMFIYEGKVSMLSNTFLKTLRKEKFILIANIISLITSVILSYISVFVYESIDIAVLSILVVIILRSNVSEYIVSKSIKVSHFFQNLVELFLTVSFVAFNMFLDPGISFIAYLSIYLIYFFFMKNKIIESIHFFKSNNNAY